jgi:hypothetical protein
MPEIFHNDFSAPPVIWHRMVGYRSINQKACGKTVL